jgi:hypothetical protein
LKFTEAFVSKNKSKQALTVSDKLWEAQLATTQNKNNIQAENLPLNSCFFYISSLNSLSLLDTILHIISPPISP